MKSSVKFVSLLITSGVLILFLTFSTQLPENNTPQLIAKGNLYNLQFPHEKIYLHLDRSSYWGSDDIWFKAYLKDSPIRDCNIYIELLNSTGRVIQKKMYWAQNGLAYGDIHLTDTIPTGVYQIRAYTNWMRNFDDFWFFRKDVVIMNLRDKQSDIETNRLKERKIDFQFFPEGGTFVTGLANKVAFKVVDQNGKGLDAIGRIVNELGNDVADLKSNFKGMGNFVLHPKEGMRYKALVTIAGQIEMIVDLPIAKPDGVSLSVNVNEPNQIDIHIAIKANASRDNLNSEYTLVGQTKGGVFYRNNLVLEKDAFNLTIEKSGLPEGIIQFNLFDKNAIPICERLVFINHHDNINVEIFPNKTTYLPRERIELDVEAFDKEGMPFVTNLSMSVYNTGNQLETEDYPNNILTHFLLSSELKGTIEDPAWYFKDDSLSTQMALDNLMLTHGYRYFEWTKIQENEFPEITYPAEECIQVRGTVKSILLGKPVQNCKVTMMSLKSLLSIYEQKTDSLGKFLFSNLYFNDTIQFSIQAINQKGKRNTQIEMDTKSSISPPASYLPVTYQYINANPVNKTTWLSEVNSDQINKKWHLSDTILLGDINISATKAGKDDGHARIYADPDFVIDVTKQDNVLGNIFEMMDGRIPGVRLEGKDFFIRGNSESALLLLDGVPVHSDFITSLSINSFDKIEVVKYAPLLGSQGNNGAIFFFLKRGHQQENINPDALGMKSTSVIGYSVIRKFYSPAYESKLPSEMKDDFRNTLYWNPIVRTDSLGMAKVSFFNSYQTGEVHVIVEGITSEGKLCRGVSKYIVTH